MVERNRSSVEHPEITISLCMIVKDEEAVLDRCLKNAVRFADELIVVDTGSSDRTREISLKYTDKVKDYVWHDDFAAARNYSYQFATCDYIMWLDADDDIEDEDIERILELKKTMSRDTGVVFFTYSGDPDDNNIFYDASLIRDRLVRRDLNPVWIYPVHEAIPVDEAWQRLLRPDIRIFHRKVKTNPGRRNITILEKEIREVDELSSFQLAYYVRELTCEEEHAKAAYAFAKLWDTGIKEEICYALYYYIKSMLYLGRKEELCLRLESYIALYGENEAALCTLGDVYRDRKEYGRSIEMFVRASQMKLDLTDYMMHFPAYIYFLPHIGCCKTYIEMNMFDEAERELAIAEKIHPDNKTLLKLKLLTDIRRQKVLKSSANN